MKRQTSCAAIAAIALAVAATAPAATNDDLYWQGGDGLLTDANYFNATASPQQANVAPLASGTFEYIGGNSTITLSDGQTITLARLRIGHNFTAGGTAAPAGPATFTVTGGSLTLAGTSVNSSPDTEGSAGALILGYNESASMNVSGGTVTVGRFISVGLDNSNDGISNAAGATATLNISGTGTVAITHASGLASTVYVGNGVPGSLTISDSGTLKATSKAVDLHVGESSSGTFTQTGGTTSFTGAISIGLGAVAGASMNVSGGTVAGSAVNVGAGTSTGSALNFSGGTLTTTGNMNVATGTGVSNTSVAVSGGTVNIGNALLLATGTAADTSFNISNDATVTTGGNLVVGDVNSTASNTSLTISDTAHLTIGNSVFLGRASSAGSAININGGTTTVAYHFLMGTSPTTPTGIVVNHTAGSLTTLNTNLANGNVANFAINDNGGGDATYNLSGTGVLTTVARGVVGRQKGTGTMNQSGGSANFNNSLHIGDAQPPAPVDIAVYGHGFYNLSGGTLAVTVPDGSTVEAFSIAPAGTATFHVFGSDATMNVTGNMGVYANTNGSTAVGTLAYTLQPGESLTKINVSGTATFQAASVLAFDTGGTTPAQTSYDLITAADVVNNGLVLSAPAGWHVDLVDGATTKTLQILQAINGDANRNGKIDADDYALIDRGAAQLAKWWHNGDFNDNGVIDSQDYLLIDTALGQQNGGHLSPDFLATRESQFGHGYVSDLVAAVPEPGALSVLAAGLLPLLGRRRRTR